MVEEFAIFPPPTYQFWKFKKREKSQILGVKHLFKTSKTQVTQICRRKNENELRRVKIQNPVFRQILGVNLTKKALFLF